MGNVQKGGGKLLDRYAISLSTPEACVVTYLSTWESGEGMEE
jgi:hypothetical protein